MDATALKKMISGEIRLKEPMSLHTSFAIGGPVDYWVEPVNKEEIKQILAWIREISLPWMVIGNGTNLLVRDKGLPGVALSLKRACRGVSRNGEEVMVGTGENLSFLVNWTVEQGLSGLEFAAGIPGTIGGAVITNAGAFGVEMGERIDRIWLLEVAGREEVLSRNEINFHYRGCSLPTEVILTRAELKLRQDSSSAVHQRVIEILKKRRQTQPLSSVSAGCIFKNPPGRSAGEIIDSLGLKGMQVGNAQISFQHANFIINLGNARAQDVITLIEKIQSQVESCLGIFLELEIKIVGC